jgi:hypothetical protein
MGTVLIVLLFVFPGGIAGTLTGVLARLRQRSAEEPLVASEMESRDAPG